MFNIPNLFTASNLIAGILSIFMCFAGHLDWACYFIYAAALFDFLDGFLARKLNVAGELGKQLDSLADMVTFGVAPGVIVTCLLIVQLEGGFTSASTMSLPELTQLRINSFLSSIATDGFGKIDVVVFAGLIIPFFSLFRLAKFNIDTRQSESFIGLPTPANTIFFTAFPLILHSTFSNNITEGLIYDIIQPHFLIPITLIMSILLVSELPLFSLKFKDFSWSNNQVRYIFLISCLILIPLFFAWSIPIIIILYLILSIIEIKRVNKAT